MRHQRKTTKLKRTAEHRDAMLANMAMSLIEHERITTTVAKAKALRPVVEKLVTLGKKNTLHARRLAIAKLRQNTHWETIKSGKRIDHVAKLFNEIAPAAKNRAGGYTRILKLANRISDAAPMALIEWVDRPGEAVTVEVAEPATEAKAPAKKSKAAAAAAPAAETSAPAAKEIPGEEAAAEASTNEATEAQADDEAVADSK